jgi:hypothetical protein
MYIGELSKRAAATPKVIRLYESIGLLECVARMDAQFKAQMHVAIARPRDHSLHRQFFCM